MSLIVNSSAGNGTSAVSVNPSGAKTAQATTTQTAQGVPTFNQTLVQMLLSTLGGQATPAQATASNGQTTVAGTGTQPTIDQSSGDTTDPQTSTVLEDLVQGVNSLDNAIAADPSLIAVLQNWLQQMQAFLNQAQSADGSEASEGAEGNSQELPLIAQNADTLRFAVQDGVQQLLSQLQAQPAQVAQTLPQIAELLQSLQTVIAPATDLGKQVGKMAEDITAIPTSMDTGAKSGLLKDLLKLAGSQAQTQTQQEDNSTAAPILVSKTFKGQHTPAEGVKSVSSLLQTGEAAEEITGQDNGVKPADSSSIVTAGQLQIRDSGLVPAKPLSTAVPVEKFAKEMSGFVVSKLDIVKLQGMTEATISLFPEHLGQVDVKITMQNGHLVAQFATEHAFAKDSLEQQMNQLRSALQSQGIQVERLEVTQNTSLSSHMYHDGRQPGSGAGQGEQKKNGRQRNLSSEDAVAAADMTEEWNEWIREVRSKEEDYGSSFVAKA
ncbi:flagellar hook-length control protein FliK [Paenibacillus zeisoli]|uniref:Flagellar hook-length control protein FliK n=1 Tax=Paenibacillus zeisoli TaxID=2496267 RepID=A0A433X6K5_9BACL|nr:flagellar hook-length control protein FliK [Paenibacillus zeisoli]RUT29714.1 flagellar hook-length control protein FliK [Paenibacillus zeisoli]